MLEDAQVGFTVAFLAGVVSCLSPCIAPLIPGYLALLSGTATDGRTKAGRIDWQLLGTSAVFVAGFTLVFVTLGAAASAGGGLLDEYRRPMVRISGGLMILMGFVMLGALRLPWLVRERRWHIEPRRFRTSETLLIGMAFGLGWTPCFGPVLAVILAYTSTAETVREGTLLLTAYALGMGLPFLLLGVGVGWFDRFARMLRRHSGVMTALSGLTMLVLGGLFVTDRFFYITIAVQRFYYSTFGG